MTPARLLPSCAPTVSRPPRVISCSHLLGLVSVVLYHTVPYIGYHTPHFRRTGRPLRVPYRAPPDEERNVAYEIGRPRRPTNIPLELSIVSLAAGTFLMELGTVSVDRGRLLVNCSRVTCHVQHSNVSTSRGLREGTRKRCDLGEAHIKFPRCLWWASSSVVWI